MLRSAAVAMLLATAVGGLTDGQALDVVTAKR